MYGRSGGARAPPAEEYLKRRRRKRRKESRRNAEENAERNNISHPTEKVTNAGHMDIPQFF